MTQLEQISHAFMKFMRGKYRLDEIGDGKDELKFKQGQKTIVTVYIHEDRYTFLIIFGKKEREQFETVRAEFSSWLLDCYDNAKIYHDGKWIFSDVSRLEQLEDIKKLILIKKKPNRKPFPKENAVYSSCGHRCDLCVHYADLDDEMRQKLITPLTRVWGENDDFKTMRCGGCNSEACYCMDDPCIQKCCAAEKGVTACRQCAEYPCFNATVSNPTSVIHTNVVLADDVTWAILPYAPMQYEDV